MPFKSEKQRKWMHKNLPDLAEQWEKKYGSKPKPEKQRAKRKQKRGGK